MKSPDVVLVVCCNKRDFFFAKICIASIRYYYPEIEIELVKDIGNGNFNTIELEKVFNIKLVNLGQKKLGWGSAKFHYLFQMPKGKKVLFLDADIVFAGPFLERVEPLFRKNDYVVSAEFESNPYSDWVRNIYFNTADIEIMYPEYKYPGYFFNTGQIFTTVGAVEESELNEFFDKNNYPFWKKPETFPLVDQSIYNYLLPSLALRGKIKLGTGQFMLWSKSETAKNITLAEIKGKTFEGGLIHWAGDIRTAYLNKMTRADILIFFENYYYRRIFIGNVKKHLAKINPIIKFYARKLLKKLK